ncbi:MAG TPA: phosphotransferase [Candidatus Nanopelagicales bacterium]|nr:phosphotransferase [Candidatus Nanopelagicales bacterium]
MIATPQRWTDPAWQEDALGWADSALEAHGLRRTAWTQPHVRPWSTMLRLETDRDRVWLKANGDGTRYEAGLLQLLADLDAPCTPRPLAVDAQRGLTLMPDGGPVSRTAHGGLTPIEVTTDQLVAYAALQRSLEPDVDALIAAGADDLRPRALAGRLEQRIAELLDERPPGRLEPGDAARLRAVLPAYAEICAELEEAGVAASLNHDDLHDNNILVSGPVFIDWGDSCVSHPFSTLLVTLRSVAFHHGTAIDDPRLDRIADAYLEAWTDVADRATLRRQAQLAVRVGPLSRSMSYVNALAGADDAAWQEDGDAVPGWLLELLEPALPLQAPLLSTV